MASERAPALRPLGMGDVLDELFTLYRRGFKTFMVIAGIVHLPLALLALPLAMSSAAFWRNQPGAPQFWFGMRYFATGPATEAWQQALGILIVLISSVAGVLEMAAMVYVTSALYVGDTITVGSAYRQALGRFWALFRIGILFVVALLAVGVGWILPATLNPALICVTSPLIGLLVIWLGVRWCLAVPALVLEVASAFGALQRSAALVRGAWWRTAITLVLMSILMSVLWMIALGLSEALIGGIQAVVAPGVNGPTDWAAVLGSLLNNAIGWLVAPLLYIGLTVMYYDRRVRAEAYDLSLLARDLGAPAPDAPTP